jgi:methyltransferase family protein
MAAALHAVERAGYARHHRHIQARSCDALPHLLAEKVAVQMAYIDGAHDFANCFVDYFYLDKMLDVGGVLSFNDTGWLGVWSTIRYLEHGERYEEIDVGLRRSYAGRNPAITTVRWLGNLQRQDRYFRKTKVLRPD